MLTGKVSSNATRVPWELNCSWMLK
uniref:Uncharacterized protein n=1 Tax=Phlebotomus papatasi TaxID=29031 RepID=A0A1B0D694_PHLPP